jgi:hypothetical protein
VDVEHQPLVPRLSAQVFTKAIDDDKRSAVSVQSSKELSPALFFDSTTTKSTVEIGESVGTGAYPGFDKDWDHWLTASNPNVSELSDHEKANVEDLCIKARHNVVVVQQIEELMEPKTLSPTTPRPLLSPLALLCSTSMFPSYTPKTCSMITDRSGSTRSTV